jgi:type I restriction enzyme S subunit
VSFPRYPKYKESGVDWLGEVPDHWSTPPLYVRYEAVLGKMLDEKRITRTFLLPYLRNVDVQWDRVNVDELPEMDIAPDELERFTLKRGDILVCEGGEVGRTAIWAGELEPCAFQKAIHRLRPHAAESPRFLYYCMSFAASTGVFIAEGNPNTIPHLTGEKLRRYRFPTPPRSEQIAVATFLDREIGRIDALLAEQRHLIDVLKEKRQAVVSHAVTKGLNPHAPMKPSGVEWLEDVPAHWRLSSVKRLASIGNGSTPNRDNLDYWTDGTYPWLTSSAVNRDSITTAEEFVTPLALQECHLPRITPPAVLVGITGQGRTRGMASTLLFEATINQHVAFIKPLADVDVYFLRLAFDMLYPFIRRDSEEGGSTKGAITCEQIGNLKIAVPPPNEQADIVLWCGSQSKRFDQLTSDAERAVDLLQERRTALISAAVTGKIDVRGLVETEAA